MPFYWQASSGKKKRKKKRHHDLAGMFKGSGDECVLIH